MTLEQIQNQIRWLHGYMTSQLDIGLDDKAEIKSNWSKVYKIITEIRYSIEDEELAKQPLNQ